MYFHHVNSLSRPILCLLIFAACPHLPCFHQLHAEPVNPSSPPRKIDQIAPAENAWKPILGIKFSEGYDSNLYWMQVTSLANRSSILTKITPLVGVIYKEGDYQFKLSYAPEIAFYHSNSEEDYQRHQLTTEFKGKADAWSFQLSGLLEVTDGSDASVTWPGGAANVPAMGNPEARNRRDNLFGKHNTSVRYDWETFFLRASSDSLTWDFMTDEKSSQQPGGFYQNFYDRHSITSGIDFGWKPEYGEHWIGIRYGTQFAGHSGISPQYYENDFLRVVYGNKTQPFPWLKTGGEIGADFLFFGDTFDNPGFEKQQSILYADLTADFSPSSRDTIRLWVRRFMLPSSGGNDLFMDSTYRISWEHSWDLQATDKKSTTKIITSPWFKAYENDFFKSNRRDLFYQPGFQLIYLHDQHWKISAEYSFTWADSAVEGFPARDFHRHLVEISLAWQY